MKKEILYKYVLKSEVFTFNGKKYKKQNDFYALPIDGNHPTKHFKPFYLCDVEYKTELSSDLVDKIQTSI